MNANALPLLGELCGVGGDDTAQESSLLLHPRPSPLPSSLSALAKDVSGEGNVSKFFQTNPTIQFSRCSKAIAGRFTGLRP